MIKQILLVGAGGAIGSILRFLTSHFVGAVCIATFPIATFIVNVLGCFCIGLFSNIVPAGNARFFLIAGFCGGFTTFSAFANETLVLISNSHTSLAFAYTLLSCVVGICAVWLGMYVSRQFA